MTSFDLLSLDPNLFDRVINKLKPESYFRLQQASKLINEAFHKNKGICIHVSKSYDLYFKNDERQRKWSNEKDVECFYGVRFEKFWPRGHFFNEKPEIFHQNCNFLKEYRITCDKLDLDWPDVPGEHIQKLLEIVKPRIARLQRGGPNRYELLFQAKTLKGVYLSLNVDTVPTVLPQLLSRYSIVHVSTSVSQSSHHLTLLRSLLDLLRSRPFSNLRSFSINSNSPFMVSDEISIEDVEREFNELTWEYERDGNNSDEEESDYWAAEEEEVTERFNAVAQLPHGPSVRIEVTNMICDSRTFLKVQLGSAEYF